MKHLLLFVCASVMFCQNIFSTQKEYKNARTDNNICADISFCIVDLKFDGQNFKICEFGEARISTFKGLDKYFWDKFWHYLKQFNLPIWYVGRFYLPGFKEMRAYESLINCGGERLSSLDVLKKNARFIKLVGNGKIKDPCNISNYKAIVCTAEMNRLVRNFKKKYPNVLVVDMATADYMTNKIKTTALLDDDEFRKYCPKFKVLKRVLSSDVSSYAQDSAESIIKEFNSDYYVVKPACGTMGRGIFIVSRKELKDILNYTLRLYPYSENGSKELSTCSNAARASADKKIKGPIAYWQNDKSDVCLVEEFVSSKIISVSDKLYDATIRLIFTLCYDNHTPKIEIFGGYWKTPRAALNEHGNFVTKHQSGTTAVDRTEIAPNDYQVVTAAFKDFMLPCYLKMIGLENGIL